MRIALHLTGPCAAGSADFQTFEITVTDLPAAIPGDMDLDGDTDFDDIDDFVKGLTDPAGYEAMFGVPPSLNGDTDGDMDQDFDDISGFVAILSGGLTSFSGTLDAQYDVASVELDLAEMALTGSIAEKSQVPAATAKVIDTVFAQEFTRNDETQFRQAAHRRARLDKTSEDLFRFRRMEVANRKAFSEEVIDAIWSKKGEAPIF